MRNALKYIQFSLIFLVMFCSLLGCAPSEPTEVAMTAGNEQITIQWKASEGASSYNIYWSPVGGELLASVKRSREYPALTRMAD